MEVNKNKPYIGLSSTKTTFLSVSCVSLNSFGVSLGKNWVTTCPAFRKRLGTALEYTLPEHFSSSCDLNNNVKLLTCPVDVENLLLDILHVEQTLNTSSYTSDSQSMGREPNMGCEGSKNGPRQGNSNLSKRTFFFSLFKFFQFRHILNYCINAFHFASSY